MILFYYEVVNRARHTPRTWRVHFFWIICVSMCRVMSASISAPWTSGHENLEKRKEIGEEGKHQRTPNQTLKIKLSFGHNQLTPARVHTSMSWVHSGGKKTLSLHAISTVHSHNFQRVLKFQQDFVMYDEDMRIEKRTHNGIHAKRTTKVMTLLQRTEEPINCLIVCLRERERESERFCGPSRLAFETGWFFIGPIKRWQMSWRARFGL